MEARFWSKVDKSGECWLWTNRLDRDGYGTFHRTSKRPARAHRVAYELAHGPIPKGLCVCHRCDVPACVNPAHLFLGTQGENSADRDAKGRVCHGERTPWSVLTEERVRGIVARLKQGDRVLQIARDEGVTSSAIYQIRCGRNWKQVAR